MKYKIYIIYLEIKNHNFMCCQFFFVQQNNADNCSKGRQFYLFRSLDNITHYIFTRLSHSSFFL